MSERSIGLIELSSVAAGYLVADTMLKAGNVRLLLSRSICSGKFMVLIGGETAAVQSAISAGAESANGCLIDQFVIANVHPDVFVALGRSQPVEPTGALGVLESFNVATMIQAADVAAKAAAVTLLGDPVGHGPRRQSLLHDDRRCGLGAIRDGRWPSGDQRSGCAGECDRDLPSTSRRLPRDCVGFCSGTREGLEVWPLRSHEFGQLQVGGRSHGRSSASEPGKGQLNGN